VIARISTTIAVLAAALAALAPVAGAADLERLIAPLEACPGQTDLAAPAAAQERAMHCLSNFARQQAGVGSLGDADSLDRSAIDKSEDILRCDSFSHYACGRNFTYWMERVGYVPARCWRAGENIAWGTGKLASPRAVFRAWIHSPEHRANILGRYSQIGIGMVVGGLRGRQDVHVWTQHFGSHCGRSQSGDGPRLARLAAARAVG
jgi:uncharacterized protein YkwD